MNFSITVYKLYIFPNRWQVHSSKRRPLKKKKLIYENANNAKNSEPTIMAIGKATRPATKLAPVAAALALVLAIVQITRNGSYTEI